MNVDASNKKKEMVCFVDKEQPYSPLWNTKQVQETVKCSDTQHKFGVNVQRVIAQIPIQKSEVTPETGICSQSDPLVSQSNEQVNLVQNQDNKNSTITQETDTRPATATHADVPFLSPGQQMQPTIPTVPTQFPVRNAANPFSVPAQTILPNQAETFLGQMTAIPSIVNGMNAIIQIQTVIQDGESYKYGCLVQVKTNQAKYYEIPVTAFQDLKWLFKIPEFALTHGQKSKAMALAYLSQLVQQFDSKGCITILTDAPGWHQNMYGSIFYATPSGCVGVLNPLMRSKTGQDIREYGGTLELLFRDFTKLCALTPQKPIASIMLLYTVMCSMSTLYELAGIPIKFLLFLHGFRGTFKTQLGLVLTQIASRTKPIYQFNSTTAGLESAFKVYRDAVMLVDDLKPPLTQEEERAQHKNLEFLIRVYGDGTGKQRNLEFQSGENHIKQYNPEGGLVVTGEYIPSTAESSISRCLHLNLESGDVNVALLTEIQTDRTILERFLFGFIDFITKNYQEIFMFIKSNLIHYREQMYSIKLSNPRYGEYHAQLSTAYAVVMEFFKRTAQIDQTELVNTGNRLQSAIQSVIFENERNLSHKSPISALCEAIIYGIESGLYPVVDMNASACGVNTIFEGPDEIHIPQPLVKEMKDRFDKDEGITASRSSSSAKNLSKELINHGIVIPFREGNGIRAAGKIPAHGSRRYFRVIRDKLYGSVGL